MRNIQRKQDDLTVDGEISRGEILGTDVQSVGNLASLYLSITVCPTLVKRVFLLNPGICCATGSEKFDNLCGIKNMRTVLNQSQSQWPGRLASVS
jgi:hypothetical protein